MLNQGLGQSEGSVSRTTNGHDNYNYIIMTLRVVCACLQSPVQG